MKFTWGWILLVPADMFSVSLPTNGLLLPALTLLLTRVSSSSLSAPDIPHIAAFFGTKTRYEEVNPHLLRDALSVNASVLKPPPTERCSPVHLTAVIRHGSRYPTVKNIRRIQKLSELVRREASRGGDGEEGWLRDIRSRWETWYTEDMDGEDTRKTFIRCSDLILMMNLLLLLLLLFRSAGDEGQGGPPSARPSPGLLVPVAAVGGEPEEPEDQLQDQLQAPVREQRGVLPGGSAPALGSTR